MIRLFRRQKAAPIVPEAELARRLVDPTYTCACCGEVVNAVRCLHPEAPFSWKNPPEPADDAVFDEGGAEIFTYNYARRDGDNLLRAYLPIPVKGTEGSVFLGVWCSLKVGNHARFRAAQQRGDADKLGDLHSWLYTQLPRLTGPLLTEGVVVPYSEGRTPLYWITTEKHPFYAAQQEGLTASAILDVYESFGCGDVVAHLRA
ncbi:DUF2199 domain-containing protein [Gymnodinialimonas ceratoperidinii]|uniref:DUF2199 domain-containing protein n=1 Tax=Gymnodinialimonas ceratoperidinii TaxID=2856823 RepID=A0A8F6YC40_9RHOB|nr:DUF2199 domain-containing protein [Gymnodinialimonas ceratoperidinii]QXT38827.1 DUF2199 domain-containing protein [Gymnodinialimonas ceratoperidinii]